MLCSSLVLHIENSIHKLRGYPHFCMLLKKIIKKIEKKYYDRSICDMSFHKHANLNSTYTSINKNNKFDYK